MIGMVTITYAALKIQGSLPQNMSRKHAFVSCQNATEGQKSAITAPTVTPVSTNLPNLNYSLPA